MSENLDALFSDDPPVPGGSLDVAMEHYTDAPWYGALVGCSLCTCRVEAMRVVPGEGPVIAQIGFLGRNPGKEEDRQGRPFIGKAGDELETWIAQLGLSRMKVLVTNLVKCHTTKDRPPAALEIKTCAPKWFKSELETFSQLRVLVTLGDEAARFVLGIHAPGMSKVAFAPMKVRVDGDPNRRELTVFPLPHPAYILRKPGVRPMLTEPETGVLPRIVDYLKQHEAAAYAASRG